MGVWDGERWEWKLAWHRPRFAWEQQLLQQLLQTLQSVQLKRIELDNLFWQYEASGTFTVKSAYISLVTNRFEEISKLYQVLWKVQAPQSALHLAWRIFKRKIATKDSLLHRQIDVGDDRCVLCRSDTETVNHLFFTCPVSRQVWMECYKWGQISTVLPNQSQEHFMQHTFPGVKTKGDLGWKTVWIAAVFSIWYHRNAVVFNGAVVDAEEIQVMTKTRAWIWLNAIAKGSKFSYSDWIGNPQICLQYLDKG